MDKTLVSELRQMFIDGATPSRMMYHIATRHGQTEQVAHSIRECFREAFGIPLLRNVVSEEDYSPSSRHAHYNRDVVPEIIQRISDWNTVGLEGSWLQDLSVHSLSEHMESLKSARFEELTRIWHDLGDKEQHYIVQKAAIINHQWEMLKTLATMAERLQERVVELEERLKEQRSEKTSSERTAVP